MIGVWNPGDHPPAFSQADLVAAVHRIREPIHVVRDPDSGRMGIAFGGHPRSAAGDGAGWHWLATLPALYPEWLGDRSFGDVHGVRFPYVAGAMANGIATTRLVDAVARAGCLGFFGAAGLDRERVEAAVIELGSALDPAGLPWGSNLIHSPNEPELEQAVADLYTRRGVRRVSASAYMRLTPAVVGHAYRGVRTRPDGRIHRENHVFAKISHVEVARCFLEPAPADILAWLVDTGRLTRDEAALARRLPVAEDITVESDSGGHTDNRPLTALFPGICTLRDRLAARHGYPRPIRVGAAGGLGTPSAVAAAFSLGAAYVLTGSVNQATVESGLADRGREMLATAGLADCVMAPAADMFEMGVKVQVLGRGTMFAVRAKKLYELYRGYASVDEIPAEERARLETQVFRAPLDEVWRSTREFWRQRDARELERAARDPRHAMALMFRAYLGLSSKWAIAGQRDRQIDYQIWCGPAMGAFNGWAEGSFLAAPENRMVAQLALNLLEGAAVVTRAQQLRTYGVAVPAAAFDYRPRPLA